MKISTLANVILAMDDKYVIDTLSAEISKEMGRSVRLHKDMPRLIRSLIENRIDPYDCSIWICLYGVDVKIDLFSDIDSRFSMVTSDDDRLQGLPSVVQIASFKTIIKMAKSISEASGYAHNSYCYPSFALDNCKPISELDLDRWADHPCVTYILMSERKVDVTKYLQH